MAKVHIDDPSFQRSQHASNRQLCMLKEIASSPRSTIGIEKLATYSQVTVRANKRRGWIEENRWKNGIVLTWAGEQLLRSYAHADFLRKIATMHFASNIHLKIQDKRAATKNIHVVRRKAA